MKKTFVMSLEDGNFEQEVPVELLIEEEGRFVQIAGSLPPAPQILQFYKTLIVAIFTWVTGLRELKPIAGEPPSNIFIPELNLIHKLREMLITSLNCWLNSESFRPIYEALQASLTTGDDVRFIMQTANMCQICKLPWHLSDLFKGFPDAEIAFIPLNQPVPSLSQTPATGKVKILAILGDGKCINIHRDLEMLKQLPDAEVCVLKIKYIQEINKQLSEQHWDILFFTGHTCTKYETGRMYINETYYLTIEELKSALKNAIARGLKLAIFNSCDGSGLARQLAELQMPKTIFMREKVPDMVAQVFLMNFLQAFAFDGKDLYLSVNEARKSLERLESRFPCASWLPAICDNIPETPLTWDMF